MQLGAAYEARLEEARRGGFTERLHARDRLGRWRDMPSALKVEAARAAAGGRPTVRERYEDRVEAFMNRQPRGTASPAWLHTDRIEAGAIRDVLARLRASDEVNIRGVNVRRRDQRLFVTGAGRTEQVDIPEGTNANAIQAAHARAADAVLRQRRDQDRFRGAASPGVVSTRFSDPEVAEMAEDLRGSRRLGEEWFDRFSGLASQRDVDMLTDEQLMRLSRAVEREDVRDEHLSDMIFVASQKWPQRSRWQRAGTASPGVGGSGGLHATAPDGRYAQAWEDRQGGGWRVGFWDRSRAGGPDAYTSVPSEDAARAFMTRFAKGGSAGTASPGVSVRVVGGGDKHESFPAMYAAASDEDLVAAYHSSLNARRTREIEGELIGRKIMELDPTTGGFRWSAKGRRVDRRRGRPLSMVKGTASPGLPTAPARAQWGRTTRNALGALTPEERREAADMLQLELEDGPDRAHENVSQIESDWKAAGYSSQRVAQAVVAALRHRLAHRRHH